jgi:hypothetical protein
MPEEKAQLFFRKRENKRRYFIHVQVENRAFLRYNKGIKKSFHERKERYQ